jgi:hypothetical protein
MKTVTLWFLQTFIGIAFIVMILNQNWEEIKLHFDTTKQTIIKEVTPAPDNANIDAVSYETVSVNKNGQHLIPHVIAMGTSQEIAHFALEYDSLVKDMNNGVEKATIQIYKNQMDYEANQPSWTFENGKLSELDVKTVEPALPEVEVKTDTEKDILPE